MPTTRSRVSWIRVGLAVWDALCWGGATAALVAARYDFGTIGSARRGVITYALAAMALQLLLGWLTRLYRGRHRLASASEATTITVITVAIGVMLGLFFWFGGGQYAPRGTTLVIPLIALLGILGGRFLARVWRGTPDQAGQIDVRELLGRDPLTTGLSQVAGYLTDKVVVVTGAGGSIGSEIARQVHRCGPRELVLLDRDESALADVQLSIYRHALLDTPDVVLCDIRDREALDQVFEAHQPQVVFHAAALKHLPLLEQYPAEAWKTNVQGSLNVLACAAQHGVERFVTVSTDKAADATSVLGTTKRITEGLTAHFAQETQRTFLSVRFGNVLGSRGSVLNTFTQQIDAGGPVTVTHPDVERFFMTIPEACELVIQAGAIGEPGDVLVLDMGQPVKIVDVAHRLIAQSGAKIPIVFTGLRPNEKLSEVLFGDDEESVATSHPLIHRVRVP